MIRDLSVLRKKHYTLLETESFFEQKFYRRIIVQFPPLLIAIDLLTLLCEKPCKLEMHSS